MTQNMPRAMQGRADTLAISNLADFNIRAGQSSAAVQGGFEAMYDDKLVKDALHGTGTETFEAINYLKQVNPAQYKAENGATYPRTPFGNSLLQIAQLIKAGVGLEVSAQIERRRIIGGQRAESAVLIAQLPIIGRRRAEV